MNAPRPAPRSRRARARIEWLKKAGVWIFLVLFLVSVAGVTLVTTAFVH